MVAPLLRKYYQFSCTVRSIDQERKSGANCIRPLFYSKGEITYEAEKSENFINNGL